MKAPNTNVPKSITFSSILSSSILFFSKFIHAISGQGLHQDFFSFVRVIFGILRFFISFNFGLNVWHVNIFLGQSALPFISECVSSFVSRN